MEKQSWENDNDGDAETPLTDNTHDQVFNDMIVASVMCAKWAQRLMYTLQTGAFNCKDHKCKTITSLLGHFTDSLRSACYTLREDEDIDFDRR